MKHVIIISILFTIVGCNEANKPPEINDVITILDQKFDRTSELSQLTKDRVFDSLEKQMALLQSQPATKKEIQKFRTVQKQALQMRKRSKSLSNFFMQICSDLVVLSDGVGAIDPFYTVDDIGRFHLLDLQQIKHKDDVTSSKKLMIGDDLFNPHGQFVIDSILKYRNNLCTLIANYKDEESGREWSFSPPDALIYLGGDIVSTETYKAALKQSLKTVNPKDTAVISEIMSLLTFPEMIMEHNEVLPWISYQFNHTVVVASITIFAALKNDIVRAENIAIQHLTGRLELETFKFDKIEPQAFSKTGYINQGDSLGLKIMIAAYDSTEAMKLEYWVNDTIEK